MNKLTIAGHLGTDPEVRHTAGGLKVTTFSVAVNIRKQNKEETIWYRITIWGDRFDKMVQYLKKGSAVIVSGDLYPSIWNDKTKGDQPRLNLELTADSISFSPFGRPAEKEGQFAGAGAAQGQSARQGFGQGSQYATNPVPGNSSGSDGLNSYVEGFGATYGAGSHDNSSDDLPF